MIETFRASLGQQFEAALRTLQHCIQACPAAAWNRPVARYPFCQVVFHTLFFTDYYLGPNPAAFRGQAFHRSQADLFADYEQLEDCEPVSLYEKEPLETYLDFCRTKVASVLAEETEASLAAPTQFPRRDFSRAELYPYTLRHLQHHTAQLILRLRLDTDVDIPWYGSGW